MTKGILYYVQHVKCKLPIGTEECCDVIHQISCCKNFKLCFIETRCINWATYGHQ